MKQILWYHPSLKEKASYLRRHPTYTEKVLWYSLRRDQLGYDFHRQKPLGFFIFDFFCEKLKLVIELDGISHLEEEVIMNDAQKDKYINEIGFTILRFTDEEVNVNCEKVINKIKEYIRYYEMNTTPPQTPPQGRALKTHFLEEGS
jgi:very-short-patch-repair endonuclease